MRVLIAPDKLKGSLSASDAAECIAQGIRQVVPDAQIDQCPIADGGEGTVAALIQSHGGRMITKKVTGPLPEMKVDASFAMLADNQTAVIEMAAASGLALLKLEDRNPLYSTTFGTGELIAHAIRAGAKKILLGLGGSATIDAGIGMAQACGFTILTLDGEPTSLTEPLCGRDLSNILMVKQGRGEITTGIKIIALTDVTNPLFGPTGAPRIYGPQKGASPAIVEQLDTDLKSLAHRTGHEAQALHPGAGAAGGLGFGVVAFLNGTLANGFGYIADAVNLKDRLKQTDLCFTAEGRLDSQTTHGKCVAGVARLCQAQNVPCVALAGSVEGNLDSLPGLTASFSICDGPMSLEQATRDVKQLITITAKNCMKLWIASLCQR